MKRNKLIAFFAFQVAFLLWCFKIHSHFFEFTPADQAGLAIAAVVPLLLVQIRLELKTQWPWLPLIVLPLAIQPFVQWTLEFFSDAWIILYIALVLSGILLILMQMRTLALLGVVAPALVWLLPYHFEPNQVRYYDRLAQTIQTRAGEVDIVTWKEDQWIYYNNALVLSTVDGHMHSETLAHTTLPFFKHPRVLLIGDDFGFTQKEVAKYPSDTYHLPLDVELSATKNRKPKEVTLIGTDIMEYLTSDSSSFDVIIVDLPDPGLLPTQHFYQSSFYTLCIKKLQENGLFITNAGSYYTPEKHYRSIASILETEGMQSQILQALIPTLGHRAWVLAGRELPDLKSLQVDVPTMWFNQDAIALLQAKGKESYPF